MESYIKLMTKLQLGKSGQLESIQEKEIDEIGSIKVDTDLSKPERIVRFLNNVKNPYIFKVNGVKVKFEFEENGKNINQCFESLIKNKIKL